MLIINDNIIEAAIFDLDGTLVDSMSHWSNVDKEYLAKRNINVPENLFLDIKEGNSFLEVASYFKQRFDLSDSITDILKEWTILVAHHYKTEIKLKPGVKRFLDMLKHQGIKLGIGTSNSLELASLALKYNNIEDYFETIITGCRDIKGKPYPDIFNNVASNLEIKPANCFVCEDSLVGVKAAKRAGMHTIAVYDSFSKQDIETIKNISDYFAYDFYQIIEYIKSFIYDSKESN